MNIAAFKAQVAKAKQVQAANSANDKLANHVGEQMIVSGIHITKDVEIKNAGLILDKVTFTLVDGTALDGWHEAATSRANDLIEALGEGPYQYPLLMEIKESPTKRGVTVYAELIDIFDPKGELAHQLAVEETDAYFAEGTDEPTQDAEQNSCDDLTADQTPDPAAN